MNKEEQCVNANPSSWQQELLTNIKSVSELVQSGFISKVSVANLEAVEKTFPLNIPQYYLGLINIDEPNDPIRKMCIPTESEYEEILGQESDPYGDDLNSVTPRLVHKYPYSALLVALEYCSMYCRHCFRKRLVGVESVSINNYERELEYIREHTEIRNVVISGGDPLFLPNAKLGWLLEELSKIKHLNFVRIGTRVPAVFPLRAQDEDLLVHIQDFSQKKSLYIPVQFNHPREINSTSINAIKALREAGAILTNQSVLLKGVNDSTQVLVALMESLVAIGVSPYYVYQCMPVRNAGHIFQVPLSQGVKIITEARDLLDGYSKRFKYIVAHKLGKYEVNGILDGKLLLSRMHKRRDGLKVRDFLQVSAEESRTWVEDEEILSL